MFHRGSYGDEDALHYARKTKAMRCRYIVYNRVLDSASIVVDTFVSSFRLTLSIVTGSLDASIERNSQKRQGSFTALRFLKCWLQMSWQKKAPSASACQYSKSKDISTLFRCSMSLFYWKIIVLPYCSQFQRAQQPNAAIHNIGAFVRCGTVALFWNILLLFDSVFFCCWNCCGNMLKLL